IALGVLFFALVIIGSYAEEGGFDPYEYFSEDYDYYEDFLGDDLHEDGYYDTLNKALAPVGACFK
ncbi:MAG: hypothetical protein IJZ13_04675, partial [Clostridia bacterium]|nr:hypothetical protein [Clostridia bacterium]